MTLSARGVFRLCTQLEAPVSQCVRRAQCAGRAFQSGHPPHRNATRPITTAQTLAKKDRHNPRVGEHTASARTSRHDQHPRVSSREKQQKSGRKRPSPARRRQRPTPPRHAVLPDLGLTSNQLGALSGVSGDVVFTCASQLDDTIFDTTAVLSPSLVELVTEDLGLNIAFRPQTLPLLSQDEEREILATSTEPRMPVITVMGHVDHGKTSLLDALRNSDVAKHERGGITQSVAAFRVSIARKGQADSGEAENSFATFIDTPGHAAFKAMRANGTVGTDIVILVVAADDGVMPQTIEAAELAKAANVPVIVAINKCDRPGADPDKVRYQLLERLGINTEQLGGDVQCSDISAKTGSNLRELLEAISLQSEMLNLRSRSDVRGHGICLESRVDKSLGSVATVVVRMGSLRKGDHVAFQSPYALHGPLYGRIRELLGSGSEAMKEAGPGVAVGVVGIRETIPPGAELRVMRTEREARSLSGTMVARNAEAVSTIELGNSLYAEVLVQKQQREEGERKDGEKREEGEEGKENVLTKGDEKRKQNVVVLVKGDVKGSADAVAQCIRGLSTPEIGVRVIGVGVGDVSEKDVQMASVGHKVKGNTDVCMIVGFNVRMSGSVAKAAQRAGLEIKQDSIIYRLEESVRDKVESLAASHRRVEQCIGRANVVRVFEEGKIGGCAVDDGSFAVGKMARVMRLPSVDDDERVWKEVGRAKVASIRRFAKVVNAVRKGEECGIGLEDWASFEAGDRIECVSVEGQDSGSSQQPR